MGEPEIDVTLVRRLLRAQHPQWAELAIRAAELDGWDNSTFRLGDDLSVRLPNHDELIAQVDKEQRWLPTLAPHLPVAIPTPVARGRPGSGFGRPWSVNRWLDGTPLALVDLHDVALDRLALDLAGFLTGLHRVPTDGAPQPGVHSYGRGGPLAAFDADVRATIDQLDGRIDIAGASDVWDAALARTFAGPDVWVHGDLTGSNLLVGDGRLAAVLDFGCAAVGDPACDLTMAWTTFEGPSRERFVRSAPVGDDAWARARGWVLWKAIKALPTLPEDDPRNDGTRLGWRWPARQVVERVIADHRGSRAAARANLE